MRLSIIVLSICCLWSCKSNQELDIQGHRGYRGLYPENSIIAFQKALELGVNTLEFDVVISKDQKVVVSHEPFMNHEIVLDPYGETISEASERSYNIYTMPYDSVILYDSGLKVHPRFPDQNKVKVVKPLLKEVISLGELLSEGTIHYNIEIKSKPEYDLLYSPSIEDYVSLVLNQVYSQGVTERTIIQSFDIRALEEVKRQDPKLQTALLVDGNEHIENKLSKLTFSPTIISPYFKLLDKKTVKSLQQKGFQVIPWTVNNPNDIQAVLALGVDGIISDFPERIVGALN